MPARTRATAADQRAYRAASLLRMIQCKQNSVCVVATRILMRKDRRNVTSYRMSENQLADSAAVVTVSGRMPMLAAATLSRLVFFTRYMASSARCSNPSLVRESTGYDATPTLGVTRTLTPD